MEVIRASIGQFARQNIRFFIELRGETTIRVQRMDNVNREMMGHFLSTKFLENLVSSHSTALTESLQKWKGVLKSKKFNKEDDVEFSEYFKAAKNWLDQRKSNMLNEVIWIPLFSVIHQVHSKPIRFEYRRYRRWKHSYFSTKPECFHDIYGIPLCSNHYVNRCGSCLKSKQQLTRSAAMMFFFDRFPNLQHRYSHYLHLLILLNMMQSTVSFDSFGSKLLIPSRIFVKMKDQMPIFGVIIHELCVILCHPSSYNIWDHCHWSLTRHCVQTTVHLPHWAAKRRRTAKKREKECCRRVSRCSVLRNGTLKNHCCLYIVNHCI